MDKNYFFKSERLQYRGIRKEDAGKIVEWRSKPENYRNFFNAKPITLDEHLKWYEGYLHDTSRFDFMILDTDCNPIGTAGLSDITDDGCEISYMIGEESCRGLGYAQEAVGALTSVAFDELGVKHVDARIRPYNEASIAVVAGGGVL